MNAPLLMFLDTLNLAFPDALKSTVITHSTYHPGLIRCEIHIRVPLHLVESAMPDVDLKLAENRRPLRLLHEMVRSRKKLAKGKGHCSYYVYHDKTGIRVAMDVHQGHELTALCFSVDDMKPIGLCNDVPLLYKGERVALARQTANDAIITIIEPTAYLKAVCHTLRGLNSQMENTWSSTFKTFTA
jgi:hypothetical protein